MADDQGYAIYLKATGDCLVTMPTLRRAFDYVTDTLCGLAYGVEVVEGIHVLTFTERRLWQPIQVISEHRLQGDAWNDLMRQSLDGRLKGFAAMPVREFYKQSRKTSV